MPQVRLPRPAPLLRAAWEEVQRALPQDASPRLMEFGGALAFDLLLGEPPGRVHPVTAVGKAIEEASERRLPVDHPVVRLAYGAIMAAVLPFTLAHAATAGTAKWERRNRWLGLAARIYLLKSTFSVRKLIHEAKAVEFELATQNVEGARERLRSLVSRDRSQLNQRQIISAAVESLAENLTDSIVAPWLAYALFGLPGALAYRIVNTMDAMIGYHGPPYEHLGKAAARLDDLLNFIPARLSALLIAAAARAGQGDPGRALRILWRDRGRTESPNAGWTMSAMAGALGVQLENPGRYVLGEAETPLDPVHIDRAARIVQRASLSAAAMTVLLIAARTLLARRLKRQRPAAGE